MVRFIVNGWKCREWLPRCLESIECQRFLGKARVFLTIDEANDEDARMVSTFSYRFELVTRLNIEKRGAARNIWESTRDADDEILVFVDADDMIFPNALVKVLPEYNHGALLTYGSYKNASGKYPRFNGRYRNNPRKEHWMGSHLKTVHGKLFKHLPKDVFIRDGKWIMAGSDMAMMIPLIEMAGEKAIHIKKQIYIYNDVNELSDHNVNAKEQRDVDYWVRHQKPFEVL